MNPRTKNWIELIAYAGFGLVLAHYSNWHSFSGIVLIILAILCWSEAWNRWDKV